MGTDGKDTGIKGNRGKALRQGKSVVNWGQYKYRGVQMAARH